MLFSELPKGLRRGLESAGYIPAGITPIYNHRDSCTYRLTLMDGTKVILKSFNSHAHRAVIELSAYRMAAEKDIPVPEVIYPTEIPSSFATGIPNFIIVEDVPSVTLESAKNHPNHQSLLKQSAEILAKIHRIRGERLGYLMDPYTVSPNKKTKTPFSRNLRHMKKSFLSNGAADGPVRRVLEGLEADWVSRGIKERLTKERPFSFVHGDYNDRNILVAPNGNSVMAIIDWAGARFDNRHFDLPHAVDILGENGRAFLEYYTEAYGEPIDPDAYEFYSISRAFIADVSRLRSEPAARPETLERRLIEHGHADLATELAA